MKIVTITQENRYLKEILHHYYNWWGEELKKSFSEIHRYYTKSLKEETLPTIRALILNDTLIGMYEIDTKNNIEECSYEPYLANVYIKEEYRGQGFSKYLIEDAIFYARKNKIDTLYLHSRIENLYERYGFQMIKQVKTKYGKKRIFAKKINSTE